MKIEECYVGQEVIFQGREYKITDVRRDWGIVEMYRDGWFTSLRPHLLHVESVKSADPEKYKPGEKGWIPDQLRHDIDVMSVTEELVSVEVGK